MFACRRLTEPGKTFRVLRVIKEVYGARSEKFRPRYRIRLSSRAILHW